MDMEKDKIKDLFSSKLGSFEPEVPASLWGGLDQLLSSQPAPIDPSAANSSAGNAASSAGNASILKVAAVVVGLAAAVATGILFIPDNKEEVINDKIIVTEEPKTPFVEQPDTANTIVLPVEPLVAKATAPMAKQDIAPAPEETQIVVETPEPEEEKVQPKEEEKELLIPVEAPIAEVIPVLPEKKSSKGFSLGLKGDANLFAENITEKGGSILFSRNERSVKFNELLKEENGDFELEHKLPISFGVMVGKQLTSRLSLETGLVYTHLSSKIKSNSVFNIDETQKLNYLGIPLSLNYTFYELGKTRFYVSLGGMVQKNISGKYISNMNFSISDLKDADIAHDIFYSEPYYIDQSIKQSNLQYSINTSLGVSYPLYRKLYLYGTVGGAYYFDAKNKYRTIYSDRKTQLNLNLGIKFDF